MSRTHHIAALVLGTAVFTTSCGLNLQNAALGTGYAGESKRITAVFSDAAGLPLGGLVRVGQAEIGRVASIRTRNFQAIVELDVARDYPLPAATAARLELSSPLGEEFVMLEPPTQPAEGPQLTDGAVIPIERTHRGPDMENTLAAVGTLLNGSGLDQARTVVTELNTALGGREQKTRDLLRELQSVLTTLDQRRNEINNVIDSLHAVSSQLAQNKPVLEAAFTRIRPAIDTLLSEREQFTRLLGNTASLSTAANDLVRRTDDSLTAQIQQLRPVLDDLRRFDTSLGSSLSSLRRFGGLFQQATPGDYVLFNGTLDLPGTIGEILDPQAPLQQGPRNNLLEGGTR